MPDLIKTKRLIEYGERDVEAGDQVIVYDPNASAGLRTLRGNIVVGDAAGIADGTSTAPKMYTDSALKAAINGGAIPVGTTDEIKTSTDTTPKIYSPKAVGDAIDQTVDEYVTAILADDAEVAAGAAGLLPDSSQVIQNYSVVKKSISALQALTGMTAGQAAYLSLGGRSGEFIWTLGDFSTQVASDTLQGVYIASSTVAATVGCWVRKLDGYVSCQWWGIKDDGSDKSTEWQEAVNAAISLGVTLLVDVPFMVESTVEASGFERLVIRSTAPIRYGKDAAALSIRNSIDETLSVSSITSVNYPSGSTQNVSRLNVASVGGVAVGDVLQVRSDDSYLFDVTRNKAELAQVLAVSAGQIYLSLDLAETFTTNIVAEKFRKSIVDVQLICEGFGDISGPDNTGARSAVSEKNTFMSKMDIKVTNGWGAGLTRWSCWMPSARVVANRLRNDTTKFAYGYAGEDMCSTRFGRFDISANVVRHAYTTNTWPTQGTPYQDGIPRDNIVTGEGLNTTAAAWDTHPGADNTTFINTKVGTNTLDPIGPATGTQNSYQDRATNTKFINPEVGPSGFVIGTRAYSYGYDYSVTIQNPYPSKSARTANGAFLSFSSDSSSDNVIISITGGESANHTPFIDSNQSNTIIEISEHKTGQGRVRLQGSETLVLNGFTREARDSSPEAILAGGSSTVEAYDYTLLLRNGISTGELIRAIGGGNPTIWLGNLKVNRSEFYTAITDDGSTTPTVNNIRKFDSGFDDYDILRLRQYRVWVDSSNRMLTKGGVPSSESDGSCVGFGPTQTTVGASGVASALPSSPDKYARVVVSGVEYAIPLFAVS